MALGRKIVDLQEYVNLKNNVHQEIKRLTASILNLYEEYTDKAKEQLPVEKAVTTAAYTQTLPSLGQAAPADTQTTPSLQKHRQQDAKKKCKLRSL